jgi:hypothetical protein
MGNNLVVTLSEGQSASIPARQLGTDNGDGPRIVRSHFWTQFWVDGWLVTGVTSDGDSRLFSTSRIRHALQRACLGEALDFPGQGKIRVEGSRYGVVGVYFEVIVGGFRRWNRNYRPRRG